MSVARLVISEARGVGDVKLNPIGGTMSAFQTVNDRY